MRDLDELRAIWAEGDDVKRALARPADAPTWFDTADGIVELGEDWRVNDYVARGPAHGPRHSRRLARRLASSYHAEDGERW
jgi:hypothetical protein